MNTYATSSKSPHHTSSRISMEHVMEDYLDDGATPKALQIRRTGYSDSQSIPAEKHTFDASINNDSHPTPRFLRITNPDPVEDRSPYIPRRRASLASQHESESTSSNSFESEFDVESQSEQNPANMASGSMYRVDRRAAVYMPNGLPEFGQQDPSYSMRNASNAQQTLQSLADQYDDSVALNGRLKSQKSTSTKSSRNSLANFGSRLAHSTTQLLRSRSSSSVSPEALSESRAPNPVRRRCGPARTASIVESDSPNPLRDPPVTIFSQPDSNAQVALKFDEISNRIPSISLASFANSAHQNNGPGIAIVDFHVYTFMSTRNALQNQGSAIAWVIANARCTLGDRKLDLENYGTTPMQTIASGQGHVTELAMRFEPPTGCEIQATYGLLRLNEMQPGRIWPVILRVRLHTNVNSPSKVHGSSAGFSTNEILMTKVERMLQPGAMLKVTLEYNHSLFLSGHRTKSEATCEINTVPEEERRQQQFYNHERNLSRQINIPGHCRRRLTQNIDLAHGLEIGHAIFRLLNDACHTTWDSKRKCFEYTTQITTSDALELLRDFDDTAGTMLTPECKANLQRLKMQYQTVAIEAEKKFLARQSSYHSLTHKTLRTFNELGSRATRLIPGSLGRQHKPASLAESQQALFPGPQPSRINLNSPKLDKHENSRRSLIFDRNDPSIQQTLREVTNMMPAPLSPVRGFRRVAESLAFRSARNGSERQKRLFLGLEGAVDEIEEKDHAWYLEKMREVSSSSDEDEERLREMKVHTAPWMP